MTTTTATRERPILMSPEMVRAYYAGLKTQTRRVIKPQPVNEKPEVEWGWAWRKNKSEWFSGVTEKQMRREYGLPQRCPYGQPGDRLYVRETWRALHRFNSRPVPSGTYVHYEADGGEDPQGRKERLGRFGRVRPSIHMPRWASRIDLEVTSVRVERVQDISTEDVWAEGVRFPANEKGGVLWRVAPSNPAGKVPASYLPPGRLHPGQPPATEAEIALSHFADLWDTINSKRGYGWDTNCWVWVIEFPRYVP